MCPPFKEEEMAAIQERARVLEANKKPPLEERRPPPYKKVRRMVFHESMKDRAGIFRVRSSGCGGWGCGVRMSGH